jgi:hypothetical protein
MIKAQHKNWAQFIFKPYVLRLIRKHFYSLYLMEEFPPVNPDIPILLMPNHSTWWDGFFVYLLNNLTYGRPLYVMMLEEQLSKYSFFSKVGAYSIRPGHPASILETMKYSLELLHTVKNPAPMVCLFPQGEMTPASARPVKFQSGFEWLLERSKIEVMPLLLAMRVEYLEQQQPEVFFQFNSLGNLNSINKQYLESKLSQILDEMLQNIVSGNKGYSILSGKKSINQIWDNTIHPILKESKDNR